MPTVPISDNSPRIELISGASQVTFPFNYWIFNASNLTAYVNGVVDPLFTVDPAAVQNDNGGDMTFTVPKALNDSIIIERNTPIERATGFTTSGGFTPDAVNLDFTRVYAIMQELQLQIDRAITLSPSITGVTSLNITEVPVDGRALVWSGTSGDIRNSTVDIDSLAATVAADAAAAAASAASASASEASASASAASAAAAAATFGATQIDTGSTTDATPTTISSVTTTDDTAGFIEIEVIARQTGGIAGLIGDSAAYLKTVRFSNVGGTVSLGVVQNDYTDDLIDPTWGVVVGTAGADITVDVIGALNRNLNWEVFTRRRELP